MARQTSELPIMLLCLCSVRLKLILSFCLICLILSLSYLSGPATPSSRASSPPPPVFILLLFSIHNAWRASHTVTTYYRCPYSPQPSQQEAALRKKKTKKQKKIILFSVKRASLNQPTNQAYNPETRNYLKPPLPTPKSNSHKVPLADTSVTLAFPCHRFLPASLSRMSPFSGPGLLEAVSSTSPSLTTHRTPGSGLRQPPRLPLEHGPLRVWVRAWKCKARGGKSG